MKINSIIDLVKDLDTSRQTKNLNKLLIRILLHLQVEFSNYIKGLGEKYANYGNWTEKLNLFNKLLKTKKFAQKSITFSPQHGFQIISANGDILDENLLSSGEQNEIILLFRLIFEVSDNSVLLIDEPENSLHVVWQQKFLDDIQEIAKTKNLQVIVSTHSISIVARGQDNAIDLYYLQQK